MRLPGQILCSLLLIAALWALRRWMRGQGLPLPPWRLPLAALLIAVIGDPLASLLPAAPGRLVGLLDGLVSSLALLVLGVWLVLELPASLGIGRAMPRILRDLLSLAIGALLVVLSLQGAGVNLVGLVTTSAVLTAVIGLAAQETLKDLLGGVSMQIGANFREGDWIDLGDVRGRVESVRLMNTVLSTVDGAEVVVPNSQAVARAVRRFRAGEPVGHRFTLGLDYSHPPAQALQLLQEVLHNHPAVLAEPPPRVWINRFAESAVEYELLAFQAESGDGAQFRLRGALLQQIWYALSREDRRIPFPVLELHRQDPAASAADPDRSWQRPERRAELLGANPLFSGLSASQLATLAPLTRCLRFGPGETVVKEGERGDCLYQVVEGMVEVSRAGENVALLEAPAMFGEMTLLTDAPRNADVRSCGESLLLEVERQDLATLLEAHPQLLERLGELASARQQELERLSDAAARVRTSGLIATMRQLFAGLGVR
ncbi:MAG: cyclic nucleotide-binding domain-containing protein [Vulcanococcus sp.]